MSPKPKKSKQIDSNAYWKVFERNGSIGAFLMFHKTRRRSKTKSSRAKSRPSSRG